MTATTLGRTGFTGSTTLRPEAARLLTAYLVLLLAVPSALTVAALGTAGAPATILALAGFASWCWFHLHRDVDFVAPRRVRLALLGALLVVLVAYAHAMTVPLPVEELTPADSGLLKMVALTGVALLAADGLDSLDRHRQMVRALVLGVGAVATLGVVQNFTGQLWVDRISVPGLGGGVGEWQLAVRQGLSRPSGTSTHPIEYGVVLTTVLPLAIVAVRQARRWRAAYVVAVMAIAFSTFLSISRSAILCAIVGLAVLAFGWGTRARAMLAAAATLVAVVAYVTVPGLLGTIGNLFVGASEDSSIHSRTASYEVAWSFIERNPWLGRGFGTFQPSYWILDNAYLGLLIEVGVVGLAAVLAVFGCAVWAAGSAGRLAADPDDREVCRALMASVLAGAVAFAFFDTMAFPQSAGVLFLVIGLCGSALRLHVREQSWSR